ncbi:MAG TPA: tetratricopeptide repeat protein [Allocoleopsis sp.]
MILTDTAPHKVSSWNQQTYQRLKLALSLGLRRQIFVAVCDDLSLRNRLAGKLHAELGTISAAASMDGQGSPKLVSLKLNLSDPNPLAQMAQCLSQNRQFRSSTSVPGFQILGVERLTRQPPSVQRLFLRRLQAIDRNLRRMESTLLLWLPRPWFHMIQQSVPEFWQWHTGIFEFEGEPTPLPPVGASKPEASPNSVGLESGAVKGSFREDLRSLLSYDLAESDKRQPLEQITWKKQHPYPYNPSENKPAASGTPVAKIGLSSLSTTDYTTANPYPSPNSKEAVPLTQKELVTSQEQVGKGISMPLTPHSALTPYAEFGLGDLDQELETLQIDELIAYPQSPTLNSQSSESAQDTLPSGQPLQPPVATPSEQPPSQPTESPAETYLELGHYYRHAIEQGDASEENLMIAIQAYEQALHWLDKSSPQASDILNDLGNLYWMLSRCSSSTELALSYLEQAIQAYQLALAKLTAEEAPHTYAMIQNNLGAAYGDLARHKDPAESLEQSIRAYEEALRYRRADSDPMKYASTQNNLGTAHWNLAQHQASAVNLRAAIAAYKEALYYYSPQSEPLNWAMIQNNLGTAYWNLAQYEQPETWLPLATAAYQEAMKYRTPEVAPAACAATLNNLGTAYWHLADRCHDKAQQQADYLEQCITAYEKALVLTQQLSQNDPPISVNFDVFATHNNLGLAHYQLATEPQFSLAQPSKIAHLEAALEQHSQVCIGLEAQSDSYQMAFGYIIKAIRAIYNDSGIAGQNRALSKVPGQLLPEILPRL